MLSDGIYRSAYVARDLPISLYLSTLLSLSSSSVGGCESWRAATAGGPPAAAR